MLWQTFRAHRTLVAVSILTVPARESFLPGTNDSGKSFSFAAMFLLSPPPHCGQSPALATWHNNKTPAATTNAATMKRFGSCPVMNGSFSLMVSLRSGGRVDYYRLRSIAFGRPGEDQCDGDGGRGYRKPLQNRKSAFSTNCRCALLTGKAL